MDRVLHLDHRHHGKGTVLYAWHPSCQFLATVGTLTSIMNGTGGLSSSSSSPLSHASVGSSSASPTRCVWIWAINGAGLKTKEAKEKAAAAVERMGITHAGGASGAAAAAAASPSTGGIARPAASGGGGGGGGGPAPLDTESATPTGAYKLFQIFTPNPAPCIGLEWDSTGTTLAILQAAPAQEILLWHFPTQDSEYVDLGIKDPTFLRWSTASGQLAIGTGRGELLLYDRAHRTCWYANARHKKRITCGDWNNENKFAFASDDRQITICAADGKTFGQVKVKSRPTNVKFGGGHAQRENIVSVAMDRKTILLYNLDDPENALELAFQQRYGHIVSFKWFRDGYVLVGFSLGYLVVISTHLDEIGREQFCARFHSDSLRDIAYCPIRHQVATAGESEIKLIDMRDWQEVACEEVIDAKGHASGPLDKLAWTADGAYVSVSSRNGALYVYAVDTDISSGDASSRAARMRQRHLDGQSIARKMIFNPLSASGTIAAIGVVVAATTLAVSHAVGIHALDMWKIAADAWSI